MKKSFLSKQTSGAGVKCNLEDPSPTLGGSTCCNLNTRTETGGCGSALLAFQPSQIGELRFSE